MEDGFLKNKRVHDFWNTLLAIEGTSMKKIKRGYIVTGISTMIIFFIVLLYLMVSTPILVIRSPYRGYEAGYEEVFLSPSLFCSKEMKTTNGVEIDSELKSDTNKYTYNTQTRKVVTKNKTYLYEGKYEMSLCMNHDRQQVILSVYDTQAPLFLEYNTRMTIEQGMTTKELAPYFPIMDYDDKKEVILFMEDIDLNKVQKTKATVLAKDSHGNYTELPIKLNIVSHEWAKKNPEKISRRYKDNNPSKLTITEMDEYKKTISSLDKAREDYLKKEEELAKSMGADIPDFDKYDETREEAEENLKNGSSIEEAIDQAKNETKPEKKEDKDNKEEKENNEKKEEDKVSTEDKNTTVNNDKDTTTTSKPKPEKDLSVLKLKSTNLTQWDYNSKITDTEGRDIRGYYIGNQMISSLEDNIVEAKDKDGKKSKVSIVKKRNGYVYSIGSKSIVVSVKTEWLGFTSAGLDYPVYIKCDKDATEVKFKIMVDAYDRMVHVTDPFGVTHKVPVVINETVKTVEIPLDKDSVTASHQTTYTIETGKKYTDGTDINISASVRYEYKITRE